MSNPPSDFYRDQFDPGWREREAAAAKVLREAIPPRDQPGAPVPQPSPPTI